MNHLKGTHVYMCICDVRYWTSVRASMIQYSMRVHVDGEQCRVHWFAGWLHGAWHVHEMELGSVVGVI